MARSRTLVACALFAALCAPAALAQQGDSPGPITWFGFSTVNPGKTRDAVELEMLSAPLIEKLMEDGTVLAWGIATPINHRPGDAWNHVEWVTLPDWAAIGRWADAVTAEIIALDPAETARRRALRRQIYAEGSHHDEVVRHFMSSPPDGSAKPRYVYLSHMDARDGEAERLVALMTEVVAPIGARLKDSGALVGYGGYTHELHGAPGATSHTMWYMLPDLGGIDTMHATFKDTFDEGDNARYTRSVDPATHSDTVLMILHVSNAGLR